MTHEKSNKTCEYEVGYPNKNPCTCTPPQPPAMSVPEKWEKSFDDNYCPEKNEEYWRYGAPTPMSLKSFIRTLLATDRARLIEEGRKMERERVSKEVSKLCTKFPVRESDEFDDGRLSMQREVLSAIND